MIKNDKIIKHPCFNDDGELINKFVKHFKYDMNENKNPLKYLYHIIGIGNDSENQEKRYIIYETMYPENTFTKSEENKIWVREYNEFFSKVDKNKYPNALQEYRLEPISRSFLCEKQNEYRLIYDLEVK